MRNMNEEYVQMDYRPDKFLFTIILLN